MKIAQITYSGFGGLGSVVFSLINADRLKSHHWSIGFIGDSPIDSTYPQRCIKHGIQYAAFRSKSGKPYRAWLALARWLEKIKPDAIICHSINSILACAWYSRRHDITLITVEHTANQIKDRTARIFSKLSMLLADRVVVLTEDYLTELRNTNQWLFRSKKVFIIPNGIDTETFFPKSLSNQHHSGTLRLGMAARFSLSKRQDLLVPAIKIAKDLRPSLAIELILAGDGSETRRIQHLVHQNNLTASVSFSGLLSEDAIAPWLRTLDIYVHATDGETLSTSLLQAMATGLPIIASDVSGVSNLLGRRSEYGICVANNPADFAHAILELSDNPAEGCIMGQRARNRVLDTYSQTAMLNSYLNIIATSSS